MIRKIKCKLVAVYLVCYNSVFNYAEELVLWKVPFLTVLLVDTNSAVDSENFHSGKVDVSNWIN